MDSYRLYFLNKQGNRIKRSHEFEAKHDLAALLKADEIRGDGPTELWCRDRLVEQWGPTIRPSAATGGREQNGDARMQ